MPMKMHLNHFVASLNDLSAKVEDIHNPEGMLIIHGSGLNKNRHPSFFDKPAYCRAVVGMASNMTDAAFPQ